MLCGGESRFRKRRSAGATHDGTFLSMDQPADIVILSPHLDDAVLALGGMISREVARGRTVEVWTCFTEGPALETIPAAQRPLGDYVARREEDRRALTVLGARHRWLNLRERIWRDPQTTPGSPHLPHAPRAGRLRGIGGTARDCARIDSGPIEALRPAGGRPSSRSCRGDTGGHAGNALPASIRSRALLRGSLRSRRPLQASSLCDAAPTLEAMGRTGLGKPSDGRTAVCSGDVFTRSSNRRLRPGGHAPPLVLYGCAGRSRRRAPQARRRRRNIPPR